MLPQRLVLPLPPNDDPPAVRDWAVAAQLWVASWPSEWVEGPTGQRVAVPRALWTRADWERHGAYFWDQVILAIARRQCTARSTPWVLRRQWARTAIIPFYPAFCGSTAAIATALVAWWDTSSDLPLVVRRINGREPSWAAGLWSYRVPAVTQAWLGPAPISIDWAQSDWQCLTRLTPSDDHRLPIVS